jgi:hypothetical protein
MARAPSTLTVPWNQQFATLWLVITGPKFYNAESIKRIAMPVLNEHFIQPQRWVAGATRINPTEITGTTTRTREGVRVDVESGFVEIVGGPFNGYNASIGDRWITSIKAQLRFHNPPATLARLAEARRTLPALRRAIESTTGAHVQQSVLRDSEGALPGDRGVPATPSLPSDPRNWLGVVIGATMVVGSWAIPKIAEGELL